MRLYGELGIGFPWGTLAVNVLGCALLGIVLGLVEERNALSPDVRTFLTVGFLGAMTTFSTFIWESWQYARADDPLRSGLYVVLSLAIGFAAKAGWCYAILLHFDEPGADSDLDFKDETKMRKVLRFYDQHNTSGNGLGCLLVNSMAECGSSGTDFEPVP